MKVYPDAAEAFYASTSASEGTRTTYGYVYRLLQDQFPRHTLSGFSTEMLDEFLSRGDLAPNTVRNYRNALRALFRWAHEKGEIRRDPTVHLTVRGSKRRMREPVWVRPQQIRFMVDECGDDPLGLRDAFLLCAVGLVCVKPSTFENATWAALDEYMADQRRPGIRSQLGFRAYRRWRECFAEHSDERRMLRLPAICPVTPNGPVVGRRLGGPSIRQAMARRAAAVGVEGVTPDDLRRSMVAALWVSRQWIVSDLAAAIGESSDVVYRMVSGYPWMPSPVPVTAPF